jgi:hypothetical protein
VGLWAVDDDAYVGETMSPVNLCTLSEKTGQWMRRAKIRAVVTLRCVAILFLALSTNIWAQCQSNKQLSCSVYNTCFDKYCPCENTSDGYFLRYGKKYCDRFLASNGWSEKGQKWRDQTLLCLQESIVPKLSIVEHPTCDCKAMKQFAYQTHVKCYTQPSASVCSLELADYKKIYNIIDVKDDLFGDPFGRQQMREVLSICKSDQKSTLPSGAIDWIIKILDKLN